ncbi:hypothetical protein QR685DRAFT_190463 [Neurospora intermedia]|uniref:Uncharacterized protein n=1 Tax=Neurospora intermedia TaxID=5142 RepID=A0ABR3DMT8_NEUIN
MVDSVFAFSKLRSLWIVKFTEYLNRVRAPGISWTSIISSAATLSSNLSYELSCPLGASLPEAGVLFYIRKTVHGIRSSNYATVIGRRARLELHISSYKYGSYLSLLVCLFLGLVGGSNPYIHSVPVPPKQLSLASLLSIKHHKIYHARYPLLLFLCSNSTLALSLSPPIKKKPFVLEARLNWECRQTTHQAPVSTENGYTSQFQHAMSLRRRNR